MNEDQKTPPMQTGSKGGRPAGSYKTMMPYFMQNMPVGSTMITSMRIEAINAYEKKYNVELAKEKVIIISDVSGNDTPTLTKAFSITIISREPKVKPKRIRNVNPS